MDHEQEILEISNPRLLAAIYFALLSLIATLAINVLLYSIGIENILSLPKAMVLSVVVAACFGALFGEQIIHSKKPYERHVFFLAFMMVIAALPFYDLGLLYFIKDKRPDLFTDTSFFHLAYLYLFVLVYSFILAGLWYGVIAGYAAIFLRKRLVYFFTQSLHQRPQHKD